MWHKQIGVEAIVTSSNACVENFSKTLRIVINFKLKLGTARFKNVHRTSV